MAILPKLVALLMIMRGHCTPLERRFTNENSGCGHQWMAASDVSIAQGTDSRPGFNTAVQVFCKAVDGHVVKPSEYLSMATEVYLNGAGDASRYGVLGFGHFEVHNKAGSDHKITAEKCSEYLLAISADGGRCWGSGNHDTLGGTFQVGNEEQSYHAFCDEVPPREDAVHKLYSGVLSPMTPNKGAGPPLNPWPLDSLNEIKPARCHSHNDYDRSIPLFLAMSAGCISFEADVHYSEGTAIIGHDDPDPGRSLTEQYILPLRAILDHNNGGKPGTIGLYPALPKQGITLVVDFKSSEPELLDALVKVLQPPYLIILVISGQFLPLCLRLVCILIVR